MDSPFHHLLHTNAAPSLAERKAVSTYLPVQYKDLAAWNGEVARLESLLTEAVRRRDGLQRLIDEHLILLSPIRCLHDDILREIFLHTLPETRNTAFSADEGPLLVSQICRWWRNIALTTPRLWASMHIVLPDIARIPRVVDVTKTWLERSAAVPVDFTVGLAHLWALEIRISRPLGTDFANLVSLLVAHSSRWRSVSFDIPHHDERSPLTFLSVSDVPLLRSVSFSVHHRPMGHGLDELPLSVIPSTFLTAPTLKSFKFDGRYISLPQNISWATLRQLKLTVDFGPRAENMLIPLHILQHCQQLESLDMLLTGWSLDPAPLHPITLPRLTHLSYGMYAPIGVPDLTQYMSTPALAALRLTHTRVFDLSWLPGLARSTTAGLRRLKLATGTHNPATLAAILCDPALHTVEELSMSRDPTAQHLHDPAFLLHFIPDEGATSVPLPNLRHLELADFEAISDEVLVRFVLSRAASNPRISTVPLQSLTADLKRIPDPAVDVRAELQDAIRAGLVLELKYKEEEPPPPRSKYSPLDGTERGQSRPDFGF
ncbi:hypothetical protein C8F01DRAFT_1134757 [Mycena amicta]|nr:hypothetical protein C8F01DRAFT_1134757 [Mycena amicta]